MLSNMNYNILKQQQYTSLMQILFEMVQVTMVVESEVLSLFPAWIHDTSSILPTICLDREYANFQVSYETSIIDNGQACHNSIAEMIATSSTPYTWTRGEDEYIFEYICIFVYMYVCVCFVCGVCVCRHGFILGGAELQHLYCFVGLHSNFSGLFCVLCSDRC